MRKEQITVKQAFCTLSLFIMGSTLILGTGGEAKNNGWIAGLLGMLMSLPMILIYSRIASLYPGKDLFEILELCLGAFFGKIVGLIYILYSFHLGALVLRNFGEFVNTVTMPETPMFITMFCLALLSIAAVRLGIEVIGRFSNYILPVILLIILIINIMAIPIYHFEYLKPILVNGLDKVIMGGFSSFSFPYAETVLFIGVFFSLKDQKSIYKIYLSAIVFGGLLIVMLTIRNIIILGSLVSMVHFPSYVAVSRINIGEFIQRVEVSVAIVFVVCVFIKSSVCLLVASKGIASFFKLKDYRSIVIQTGLLMAYFSYILYDSIMEMRYWAFKVYQYYAFPMQVVLPIIIWIFVEFKHKKQ